MPNMLSLLSDLVFQSVMISGNVLADLGTAGENEKVQIGANVVQRAHCALEHFAVHQHLVFRLVFRLEY